MGWEGELTDMKIEMDEIRRNLGDHRDSADARMAAIEARLSAIERAIQAISASHNPDSSSGA